jgi:hypothetical protein
VNRTTVSRRLSCIVLGAALACVAHSAHAIQVDDPTLFQVENVWDGASLGVPGRLGAMMFSQDGRTLYVVGNSEASNSAVYALPVIRDPISERVTGFGPATLFFNGNANTPGIDAGLEIGPEGTLFYTYYRSHRIGERTVTSSTVEASFDMGPTGVPVSVAGLAFSPHLFDAQSNFAQMQVSSWAGNGVYNVPLTPLGDGTYQPGTAELFVALPQQGTGAIQYVPQGRFTGNLMYVNWDFGEVRMVVIDPATGLPIDDVTGLPTLGTNTPRDVRFAYELGVGPWGLEFDPLTLDFFVSTWDGNPSNSIIQFTGAGFANQAPIANDQNVSTLRDTPVSITLTGSDPDLDTLTFTVVTAPANGTLTGTTATVVYTPNAGFVGSDQFAFKASDGQLDSNTATVTIAVEDPLLADAGADAGEGEDSGVAPDGGPNGDAATTDSGPTPDSGPAPDSGPVPDSGPAPDAGARDSGVAGDSGTTPSDAGAGGDASGAGPHGRRRDR